LKEEEWSVADDEYVLHQVFQVVRAFSKTLNNEIYRSGIYSAEWTVLTTVYKGKIQQQSDLIQYLALEPGAISRTLTKMEQKGLIKRSYRENERGKFIELTEKGMQLRQSLEEQVNAHRQRVLQGINVAERQQLKKIMSVLQKNLAAEE
jgi:MarR family transcriptional regulator for hemolysin